MEETAVTWPHKQRRVKRAKGDRIDRSTTYLQELERRRAQTQPPVETTSLPEEAEALGHYSELSQVEDAMELFSLKSDIL